MGRQNRLGEGGAIVSYHSTLNLDNSDHARIAESLSDRKPRKILSIGESARAVAGRVGVYASAYRMGLSVRAGEIEQALDAKALGQGYRDGLKGAPYRVPKKGAGSAARQNERVRKYTERKKETHVFVAGWIEKPSAAFPSPASSTQS
jgi:hypothetical protein